MGRGFISSLLVRLTPLCLTMVLTGCFDDGPQNYFDDYQTKIANVQDADEIQEDWELESLPRKQTFIEVPSLSIGLIDSYQLRQCGLFNLIAERNSILGKIADEFRNYDYQVALLEGVGKCLSNNELDPEIVELLREIEQRNSHNFHCTNGI